MLIKEIVILCANKNGIFFLKKNPCQDLSNYYM